MFGFNSAALLRAWSNQVEFSRSENNLFEVDGCGITQVEVELGCGIQSDLG